MPNSLIATLKEQPHKHTLKLFLRRPPKLSYRKRPGGLHDRSQLILVGQVKAYLHSMQHHNIDINAVRCAPHKLRVYASDVIVGDVIKRLVGKLYGLLKHGFVVHGSIVGQGGAGFHSYLPVVSITPSSLFFARRGQSNAV